MTVLWEREGKYYGEISSLVNSVGVSVINQGALQKEYGGKGTKFGF